MHQIQIDSVNAARYTPFELLQCLKEGASEAQTASRAAHDTLRALADAIAPQRVRMRPGEELFRAGERCSGLFALNSGIFRVTSRDGDARRDAGYRFRGDWLGVDGMASGFHESTALALDYCEVWTLRFDALTVAGALQPRVLAALHQAVSVERRRQRANRSGDADERTQWQVAHLLLDWSEALVRQGRPATRVALRVTCAELAAYLSRPSQAIEQAIGKLSDVNAIATSGHRKDAAVDDLAMLSSYMAGYRTRETLQ